MWHSIPLRDQIPDSKRKVSTSASGKVESVLGIRFNAPPEVLPVSVLVSVWAPRTNRTKYYQSVTECRRQERRVYRTQVGNAGAEPSNRPRSQLHQVHLPASLDFRFSHARTPAAYVPMNCTLRCHDRAGRCCQELPDPVPAILHTALSECGLASDYPVHHCARTKPFHPLAIERGATRCRSPRLKYLDP